MGASKKVRIGYKYYVGMHLILGVSPASGPVASLNKIYMGKKLAWSGAVTSNSTISVSKPNLFGGEKKEGGLSGDIDVMFGAAAQTPNTYLNSVFGALNSAYRRIFGLVLNRCYVTSMTPYIKPIAVEYSRYPASVWYAAKSNINGDANPVHMLYEILTEQDFGIRLPVDAIDTSNFQAVADTLYTEGLGLSMQLTDQVTAEDFIQSVLSHVNGILFADPSTGKLKIKLFRGDYTLGALDLYDETNIVAYESFSRPLPGEMVNDVTLVFRPRGAFEDDSFSAQNIGAIQSQGAVISAREHYPGLSTKDNAARVALQILKQYSTPLAKIVFSVNRDAWNKSPGEVIRFSRADLGISEMAVRILTIDGGTLTSGTITITCVEDIYSINDTTYVGDISTGWSNPVAAAIDATVGVMHEVPYWTIQRSFDPGYVATLEDTSAYSSLLLQKPAIATAGYALWAKPSGGNYAEADDSVYTPSALLLSSITPSQTSVTMYAMDLSISDVLAGTYAYIDSEIVRVDSYNVSTGALTIGRGCLDTVAAAHAADARIWFAEDNIGVDPTEYLTGELVYSKGLVRTGIDELAIGSATERSLTLPGRQFKPYPPGKFQINAQYYPTYMEGSFALTWSHRDRTQQLATPIIDHTSGNIGPEATVTYTAVFYGEDGALKRTVTGLATTSRTWTEEEADCGLVITGTSDPRLNNQVRVTLKAVRGADSSWQTHDFTTRRVGYGYSYGHYYGGI